MRSSANCLPSRLLDVVAREVEDLVVRHRVACAASSPVDLQVGRRPLEVVARQRRPCPCCTSLREAPVRHAVGVRRGVGASARRRAATSHDGAASCALCESTRTELVLAVAVLEVPVDALVLQQPRDEVEVALAVLHAVDPLAVACGRVLNSNLAMPWSSNTFLTMSGTVMSWKMRQSAVRVRNQSQGRTVAW